MYQECLSCPKLGVSCDGPNFVAMPAHDLLEWCKTRKARLGLSNADLAEMSGTPKGTIDRLFAGDHNDFKYETMRPLVKALVGGEWSGSPCPEPHDISEIARLKEVIQEREEQHRKEKEELKAEYTKSMSFVTSQMNDKRTAIVVLSILLGIALSLIIGFLIYDRINPHVGFFWLETGEVEETTGEVTTDDLDIQF